MKKLLIAVGTVVVLAGAGAGWWFFLRPTAANTWKAMNRAACKGDSATFFGHVDRTRLNQYMRSMVEKEAENRGLSPSSPLVEAAAKKAFDEVMQEWEDDIKHNEAGNLCRATFHDANELDGLVGWNTASGATKTSRFEKFGDRYLLVEIR